MSDPAAPDGSWHRLDSRMLLVQPVREVARFLPLLVVLLLAGGSRSGVPWELLGVVVPVVLGLLRYLTTTFRVASGRVELRTGLVSRHVRSTPLDRVRTVDLTAGPVQRVLGLSTVRIGTGTATGDEDRMELDGLPHDGARRLRDDLLRVAGVEGGQRGTAGDAGGGPTAEAAPVLVLDPRWARYAPLTSAGLVVLAGAAGAGSQVFQSADLDLPDLGGLFGDASGADVGTVSVVVSVVALVVVALVLSAVLAVVGYLATNWGFTLRHRAGAWHLVRGLLTTRETSLDDERVAGVRLHEPLSLRVAHGGRLSAVVTGLSGDEPASAVLVPPAPRAVSRRVAGAVLGHDAPVEAPLSGHGPLARRRRFSRALVPALVLAAAIGLAPAAFDASPWWLVAAALPLLVALGLAADRAAALGHAHLEGHVVARSGSIVRRRDVLADAHVIGWTWRSTWWQRRAGLTTLWATTAGGPQKVVVLDVPEDHSVALAHDVLPTVVGQFLQDSSVGRAPARGA